MDYEKAKEFKRKFIDSNIVSADGDIAKSFFDIFPELTESEDERIRKWLYDYISNCPNNNFSFYGGVGKDAVLNYLERQKEQKPAEWSEELAILEGYIISGDWSDAHKERALDILKSLRPSWKPSEEQIRALERAIVRFNSVDDIPILTELRDKLKKLM